MWSASDFTPSLPFFFSPSTSTSHQTCLTPAGECLPMSGYCCYSSPESGRSLFEDFFMPPLYRSFGFYSSYSQQCRLRHCSSFPQQLLSGTWNVRHSHGFFLLFLFAAWWLFYWRLCYLDLDDIGSIPYPLARPFLLKIESPEKLVSHFVEKRHFHPSDRRNQQLRRSVIDSSVYPEIHRIAITTHHERRRGDLARLYQAGYT